MKTGWIFSKHDNMITRDKLYVSEPKGEVEVQEIVFS